MTINSVHTIVRDRNEALIRHFNNDMMPPSIATHDIDALALTQTYRGGTVRPLSEERSAGFVWLFPNPNDSSLWVRAGSSNYRSSYKSFISQSYGEVDWTGFELYDVDHLFNRARAFAPQTLLRVEAVDKDVNRQHGASFERTNTSSSVEQGNARDMRKMTFISVLKLASINAPRDENDTQALQLIEQYFVNRGWQREAIKQSISGLMSASRRRS